MKKVLGISFGRKMGNTDVMVKTALMECEKAGCQVKFLRGDDLDIKPCTGCISCVVGMTTGRGKGGCPVKDDFHILDEALMECDAVIVGSPTYVLSPTGKFKVVCDRIGPSHDITFRKATYEEGLAAGKPADQLPDPRSFKKRVGALISVGGAMTKNWLAFMLPTMYEFTMSMGIDVVDMHEYHGAMACSMYWATTPRWSACARWARTSPRRLQPRPRRSAPAGAAKSGAYARSATAIC